MKYGIMPRAMWTLFSGSFKRELPLLTDEEQKDVMQRAKKAYVRILESIPEFDSDDDLVYNLLSGAMLASVYTELPEKPNLRAVELYYRESMTGCAAMRAHMKKEDKFSEEAQEKLALKADESLKRTNPYTWKYRYEKGSDKNSFSAYFDTCGILYLFRKLGIEEIVPAMCSYDYQMAELSHSEFTRQFTLAEGGKCCDCHYSKKIPV